MLSDARSAYTSLREHFLRYIERPDELGSAVDPLNDDKNVSFMQDCQPHIHGNSEYEARTDQKVTMEYLTPR